VFSFVFLFICCFAFIPAATGTGSSTVPAAANLSAFYATLVKASVPPQRAASARH
jgi:hypothetical protein